VEVSGNKMMSEGGGLEEHIGVCRVGVGVGREWRCEKGSSSTRSMEKSYIHVLFLKSPINVYVYVCVCVSLCVCTYVRANVRACLCVCTRYMENVIHVLLSKVQLIFKRIVCLSSDRAS
jgi:hypothetical protein